MLELSFFSRPRFAMGSLGISVTFFAMFAMFFVLTQYLQYVKGYTPLTAGLAALPSAVTMIIVSPRAPRVVGKLGLGRAVPGGMVILATGLVDWPAAVLSWGFIASRVVHTLIHTGANVVVRRFQVFLAGFAMIVLLWAWFGLRLFVIG